MKRIYRKAKSILCRIKGIKKTAYINRDYLNNEKYYFRFERKDYITNKKEESIEFFNKTNRVIKRKKSKLKIIIFSVLNLFYKINFENNKESPIFKGDILMKTRRNNIKIFNFEEDLVMNIIDDKNEYKYLEKEYNYFTKYYNIPIMEMNEDEQYIIEKHLNFKPYKDWSNKEKQDVVIEIAESLKKQVKDLKNNNIENRSTKALFTHLRRDLKGSCILEKIEEIIPDGSLNDKWPVIKCHGDLNVNNILLEDNKFYFIDWEDSDKCIFFYDFINCIFVEALDINDYSYLKRYLKGDYDNYLRDIFDYLSIEFIPENRLYYIVIYIMDRIIQFEFVQNMDKIDIVLKKYENVLAYIKTFYK